MPLRQAVERADAIMAFHRSSHAKSVYTTQHGVGTHMYRQAERVPPISSTSVIPAPTATANDVYIALQGPNWAEKSMKLSGVGLLSIDALSIDDIPSEPFSLNLSMEGLQTVPDKEAAAAMPILVNVSANSLQTLRTLQPWVRRLDNGSEFHSLSCLLASDNKLRRLDLGSVPSLVCADLSMNKLESLTELASARNLRVLVAANNEIANISALRVGGQCVVDWLFLELQISAASEPHEKPSNWHRCYFGLCGSVCRDSQQSNFWYFRSCNICNMPTLVRMPWHEYHASSLLSWRYGEHDIILFLEI